MLKAFLLDRDMQGLEVEAFYAESARETANSVWEELPLDELEKKYETEEQRKWLLERVVQCPILKFLYVQLCPPYAHIQFNHMLELKSTFIC